MEPDLSIEIGGLRLKNPVMLASGTFGNAVDCYAFADLNRLGAIIPKTVTLSPRIGNIPPRTVETAAGLLNSIGLDNEGLEGFRTRLWGRLSSLKCPVIVSIAGKADGEFVELAQAIGELEGVKAIELNLSCPNVAGGIDFATDPARCAAVVAAVRRVYDGPILAKLTPNVTDVAAVARAAESAGASAITAVNTLLGMSVDWRRRRSRLGQVFGGLSGPAIKPVALRIVYQVAQAVSIPVVAAGGITTVDDAMEFFVVGASAIQVGTASFYRPTAAWEILDGLPGALMELGARSLREVVGSFGSPRISCEIQC
ncbi:Dihydroorotate dehydrogenase, catalytic subunit [Thermogutta terrifontis]|uniref:Dihydroorotate dehydrogenase n=1 Tax=Thermogutta terrifontis TaxID=1331910 RepID=A0A286RF86_9BACT|nr:dihydroorotate dehydrogenase [Thermogutta terrifontis]ASV74626.1 Dihydroorotate dehydrogenase, catalytic subunit [Thermogutta terrifontis]